MPACGERPTCRLQGAATALGGCSDPRRECVTNEICTSIQPFCSGWRAEGRIARQFELKLHMAGLPTPASRLIIMSAARRLRLEPKVKTAPNRD
eukprot:7426804-Pyramimonas_sp.AAC.1